MSGFYRVLKAHVPQGAAAGDLGVHVLHQDDESFWLHSARFPHPLEGVVPAEQLGTTWQEFYDAVAQDVRDAVFLCRIRRTIEGDQVVARVRVADVLPGDELLADGIPPHRFAGDPTVRVRT